MKVDIFDFDLDRSLIADKPASPRDSSKLLDLSEEDRITDRVFYELPEILHEGDVLVFNDTKVIPARLYGKRGEAQVEVTLYHPVDGIRWQSFIKNAKRLRPGDTVAFYTAEIPAEKSDFTAEVLEKNGEDGVLLKFDCDPKNLGHYLEKYGSMPLPPYIKREKPADGLWSKYNDKEDYQTVYARHEGAVAAPTAGLHFTPRVLEALDKKGVKKVFLTLHVGAGTFLPVKVEDTKDHKMHAEYGVISPDACKIINEAKKNGNRIIAVGTTSLRLLESAPTTTESCTLLPAKPTFSSRRATGSKSSTTSSPISICPNRRCSCSSAPSPAPNACRRPTATPWSTNTAFILTATVRF